MTGQTRAARVSLFPRVRRPAPLALVVLLMTAAAVSAQTAAQAPAPPVTAPPKQPPLSLIFDTDIGNDVDDAMALAVIHALETRGVCRLLAVTVTKDHPAAAAFVDVINTFYGRGEIPIGVVRGGVTRDRGKFLGLAGDRAAYPHDLLSGAEAPDATTLLRRTLAAQPDGSVTLVQVGFFTNFARLLASPADAISPLTGRALIRQKVAQLSVMAGAFQAVPGQRRFLEYNVKEDVASAQALAKDWPTPIVWSGFEIGNAVTYPHASVERDLNYVRHHPIKEAYYRYQPPPHDRPTWDLTSVLAVLRPDSRYFTWSARGRVEIEADGFTRFEETPGDRGRDRVLRIDPAQTERVREAFVWLVTTPPPGASSAPRTR